MSYLTEKQRKELINLPNEQFRRWVILELQKYMMDMIDIMAQIKEDIAKIKKKLEIE